MDWIEILTGLEKDRTRIKIITSSGTFYTGQIVSLDDDFLQINDLKGNLVHIILSAITSVEEQEDD